MHCDGTLPGLYTLFEHTHTLKIKWNIFKSAMIHSAKHKHVISFDSVSKFSDESYFPRF